MSDQELKPCPFCGAEVLGPCGADYYGPFYIIKHKKDCFFPTISGQHVTRIRERSGKINVWNTRATDPMLEELARGAAMDFRRWARNGKHDNWKQEQALGRSAKIPTIKGATMTPTMEEVSGWLREAALSERAISLACLTGVLPRRFKDEADEKADLFDSRAAQVEAIMTIIKTCETCINFDGQFNDCLSSFDSSFENGADIGHCGTKFGCIHHEDKSQPLAKK